MERHHGHVVVEAQHNRNAPASAGAPTVRFVHYPDCQQLIVWLPSPGSDYCQVIVHGVDRDVVWRAGPVDDWRNGSVQLLFDTSELAPGRYRIEIHHAAGFAHEIRLRKLAAGERLPAAPPAALSPAPPSAWPSASPPAPPALPATTANPPATAPTTPPHRYHDGTGRPLPDADLDFRATAHRRLVAAAARRLEYEGTFRAGVITFVEGELRLRFWHEMGGGACKMFIDVPDPQDWERTTRQPLARRAEILQWIAERVQAEQAPSWRFEIGERAITYW